MHQERIAFTPKPSRRRLAAETEQVTVRRSTSTYAVVASPLGTAAGGWEHAAQAPPDPYSDVSDKEAHERSVRKVAEAVSDGGTRVLGRA